MLGQTTDANGRIIMLDPKTVGPMREQAFGLLFYTIAERMRKNARAQGGGGRGNLLNESDRIFLQQAKEEGIFSGSHLHTPSPPKSLTHRAKFNGRDWP